MERLWITQPKRFTALATVTQVRGEMFALDRGIFAPTSLVHRHPQPHDQGTVWMQGEKRHLTKVFERDGQVWHRVPGWHPPKGAQLNCHLDQDRRLLTSRAHTAMHLLIATLQAQGAPPLARDPEVKGGGSFRLDLAGFLQPPMVASALAAANAHVAANKAVRREPVLRELVSRVLTPQRFEPADPFPGPPDVVDGVLVDGLGGFPCDGTHVDWTGQVGRVVVAQLRPGRTTTLVGKVQAAPA